MKTKTKVWIGLGTYLAIAIALLLIFGNEGKNEDFKPQNEFKLHPWVSIHIGSLDLSINRAVLYLVLASIALFVPGIVIPAFTRIFVDDVLIGQFVEWLPPLESAR